MAPDSENVVRFNDESSEEGGEIPTEIVHGTVPTTDDINSNIVTAEINHPSSSLFDEAQPQAAPHDVFLSDDDNQSGELREYSGYFEGPEKTLEVCFRKKDSFGPPAAPSNDTRHTGLRCLSRHDLDRICARARCTILSRISNNYVDAYVLSESSLFVYPYMLVLKTCGTTTLLRCIAVLIEMGKRLGLEIDWVGYSRKNFNFPGDQAFPHQSFHQELEYLYSHRNLCDRLDGSGYTLGPVTSDHWFVFVADHTIRSKSLEIDTDRVLNIMMFDIDEDVASLFYYGNYKQGKDGETKEEETLRISKEQTSKSGIDALCPGAIIDPRAFEPCGYSMNAILFRSYSTIHITPESGSSYVSFETNQKVSSYKSLISNVVRTFRPKRFVMTLMADDLGLKQVKENPLTGSGPDKQIVVPAPRNYAGGSKQMVYKRSSCASIVVEEDCCCMMGNWTLKEDYSPAQIRANKSRGLSVS
ncbi:S-adenosylmethionine decarboxylase [Nitzschia inconspicua]|uniref:S-adenosylmethionine decarboxylase n=1 Tax=Nitzschia inconspicua TaxID=303405 RepID=A0A9K3LMG5_9STRA|nr:S-adenosylmethionine decarboxylase [Nitzschia inconspicua]